MGLFGEISDKKAVEQINQNAGMYKRETIANYNAARRNGKTPQQAFDFVKADLQKRGVRL